MATATGDLGPQVRPDYEAAQKRFKAAPEVQQCYDVTGDPDFVLVVLVRSMPEYKALTQRLFFSNRNVKAFRTLVVTERAKVGLAVPL
jgi:Lrp/AsnC family leucine-responsive transcriptional regulator